MSKKKMCTMVCVDGREIWAWETPMSLEQWEDFLRSEGVDFERIQAMMEVQRREQPTNQTNKQERGFGNVSCCLQ